MRRFAVYQQHPPLDTKRKEKNGDTIYDANLRFVREVQAASFADALALAKTLPPFKYGTGRLRFPVVEERHEQRRRIAKA